MDHLVISLVDKKYKKLLEIYENVLLQFFKTLAVGCSVYRANLFSIIDSLIISLLKKAFPDKRVPPPTLLHTSIFLYVMIHFLVNSTVVTFGISWNQKKMSLGLWVVLCKKLLVYFPIFLLANESLRGFLDKYAKWSFAVWFLVLIGQGHRNVQERGTHFWQIYLIQRLVTIVV